MFIMSEDFPHAKFDSALRDGFEPFESLSVIVCTRNRATKLVGCIEALLAMKTEGLRWELICVDNGSTDDTRKVVERFSKNSSLPIKYVYEKAERLSQARNSGLSNSSGDVLTFTDDDCIVDRYWLSNISREFREDSSLALLGGRVELHDKRDLPLGIRTHKNRVIIEPTNVFSFVGAGNMALRRCVIEKIGMFDTRFGPGAPLLAAEDSDFAYRVLKASLKAVYSPEVIVSHNHGRRSEQERANMEKAYVSARGAFYLKHTFRGDRQVMRLAYWETVKLAKQSFKDIIGGKNHGSNARLLAYLLTGAFRYLRVWVGHS
jgi:glycosyltransferase involved in cell wall biosynthesis